MTMEAPLKVIALISGGKDSFFSILHCLANGHQVVALANLHPPITGTAPGVHETGQQQAEGLASAQDGAGAGEGAGADQPDLNSFMYQTVGHQVIPLYAAATGLPLFRRPIEGTAVVQGISYPAAPGPRVPVPVGQGRGDQASPQPDLGRSEPADQEDETESLIPLLQAVLNAYPEANAISTGAILSTYQRTRVESVALRLGLVPLAYLWQFPTLPTTQPAGVGHGRRRGHSAHDDGADDGQLLRDMTAVGLEARIIKVASAGLDEDMLWENIASDVGIRRVQRAMQRFGAQSGDGAVIGEGGEFETLVLDGPMSLFKAKIVVPEAGRRIVREGGGNAWLSIAGATLEAKTTTTTDSSLTDAPPVRVPSMLEPRFQATLERLRDVNLSTEDVSCTPPAVVSAQARWDPSLNAGQQWCFVGRGSESATSVVRQTEQLVDGIRERLRSHELQSTAIVSTVIVLRHMSDFAAINKIYATLFTEPNPPSRVTISCGDRLPAGSSIAVYVNCQPSLRSDGRQGLHVQSRSYWAPANIGPYSQAIAFSQDAVTSRPASSSDRPDAPSQVFIAGQIPLVPASMGFPDEPHGSPSLQVTLGLQHLWRIGVEMRVQWWGSAVAYFPRTELPAEMRYKARLAAKAWESAHVPFPAGDGDGDDDGDENDEDGTDDDEPDPWDRRYNSRFQVFSGGADADAGAPALPDWESLRRRDEDGRRQKEKPLPCCFAAEVEELPRQAGVEWHAHVGLAGVREGSLRVFATRPSSTPESTPGFEMHHAVVESSASILVHSVAVVAAGVDTPKVDAAGSDDELLAIDVSKMLNQTTEFLKDAWSAILPQQDEARVPGVKPYLVYADAVRCVTPMPLEGADALVPCRSLWTARGDRAHMVALYKGVFRKTD